MNEQEHIKELISRYIDGEVSAQEKSEVETLLKESASGAAYYKELLKLNQALDVLPDEALSGDKEHEIVSAIARGMKEEPAMKWSSFYKASIGGGVAVMLIAALVSLQMYAKRSIQGRLRSATDDIGDQYSPGNTSVRSYTGQRQRLALSKTQQYEPYYLSTDYDVSTTDRKMVSGVPVSESPQPGTPGRMPAEQESWGPEDKEDVPPDEAWRYNPDFHTEEYDRIYENPFMTVTDNPLSTFSIDVDTASYSNVRRFLSKRQFPPADAVRIEEMVNYFTYDYPQPEGNAPFSITIKGAVCPWNPAHQLVGIGLQGKVYDAEELPPSNLVFLVDVSGSMDHPNKLPLLKSSLKMLVRQLGQDERVAIVVYAGAAGTVLESTPGSYKAKILSALDRLKAGGSTAGGAGIKLAYEIAKENYIKGGNNRVILATDGDFNVGVSSDAELVRLIEEKRQDGVFLTVLGFGMGNYKDSKMEQLADKGNGNYYYIDTEREAQKVLVQELGSTLFTIAKDVKIQVEFNPGEVKAYRLIGYENRILAKEDFNDDTKDAGELGAGHTVTALYEIVPAGSGETFRGVDELVYQQAQPVESADLMTVKLRYKQPDGDTSRLIQQAISADEVTAAPKGDFQFAATVAEFGLLLRDSQYKGQASYQQVLQQGGEALGQDPYGYRQEFLDLVRQAEQLDRRVSNPDDDYNGYTEETPGEGIQFKDRR
ncbi:MAG: VWA domain-containing protein [Candidatus Omnitrophota bacterium]|jgi:Ca-activated chloride channel family protein